MDNEGIDFVESSENDVRIDVKPSNVVDAGSSHSDSSSANGLDNRGYLDLPANESNVPSEKGSPPESLDREEIEVKVDYLPAKDGEKNRYLVFFRMSLLKEALELFLTNLK